jgi:hypothetical protein
VRRDAAQRERGGGCRGADAVQCTRIDEIACSACRLGYRSRGSKYRNEITSD